MLGTAPNPDDVSGLANGAMENSEYDLRKQMNRRTSHKMNLNTDFQTWFAISLLWCEIYIEGPIKLFLHSLFWKVFTSQQTDLLSWLQMFWGNVWELIGSSFTGCSANVCFWFSIKGWAKAWKQSPVRLLAIKYLIQRGTFYLKHLNILSRFRFASCSNGKRAVLLKFSILLVFS